MHVPTILKAGGAPPIILGLARRVPALASVLHGGPDELVFLESGLAAAAIDSVTARRTRELG